MMQGKGSIIEFEQGSSSNSSAVDRQTFYCDMLSPIQNQANHLLIPEDNMLPFPVANHKSGSFNPWNCEHPDLSGHATMKTVLDEATSSHHGPPDLVPNHVSSPRIHERRYTGNLVTDVDQMTTEGEDCMPHDASYAIDFVGNNVQVSEGGVSNFFSSCIANTEQIQSGIGSSSSCGPSVGDRYFYRGGDGRPQCSLDSRISGKRKIIEGVSEQASVGESANLLRQGEKNKQVASVESCETGRIDAQDSSAGPDTDPLEGLRPRFDAVIRARNYACNSSASAARNAESAHRNVRRTNSPQDPIFASPSLWPSGNSSRQSNIWSPPQISSFLPQHIQLPEAEPPLFFPVSGAQSTAPVPQHSRVFPWIEQSNLGASGSSLNPMISEDEVTARRVIRSIPVPFSDMRHLAQDPRNWNLSVGNSATSSVASILQIGSGSSSQPSASPTWQPPPNVSRQHPSRLSEFVRRSFSSYGSESGLQSNNIDNVSSSTQEVATSRVAAYRSRQQLLRSVLADRHNDRAVGIPMSLRMSATREGRSRMISEIHSALDFIRSGEDLRIEDVLMFDRTYIGGGFRDRHRDLRLDVDNMSYEELLALEERIGDVNTGLSDETVMKHLKHHKYSPNAMKKTENLEPCCVCQEEYVEDEDLGTLDCGHGFHAECIKQWLSYKNLCPICKTTGLVS